MTILIFVWLNTNLLTSMFIFQPNVAPDYENVSTPGFRKQAEELGDVQYASIRFHKNQENLLYDNIMPTKPKKRKDGKEEEDLVYTLVKFTNHKPGWFCEIFFFADFFFAVSKKQEYEHMSPMSPAPHYTQYSHFPCRYCS